MLADDGRVVSNFIVQALRGEPITLYGDGSQSRSFCYVDDLIEGLIRLMNSEHTGPINLVTQMNSRFASWPSRCARVSTLSCLCLRSRCRRMIRANASLRLLSPERTGLGTLRALGAGP